MSKVIRYGMFLVLALAIAGMILPAGASLVATQFGFPTIYQAGETLAFNRDTAAAFDNEAVAICFTPAVTETNGLYLAQEGATAIPFCGASLAFPTIVQTVDQAQVLTHCDFAQTKETACFSYPFAGVGGVPLPGFGFGF
ncbi:hypothetical protein CUJ83_02700 [Methanocella sp. CWC-04]|uniref:Uncharacterized protein n=1 Tax=Methanooceanicella nereidis TaxID=2052831 RepID=A0AAP2W6B4_9EURY|nr:hypothetical protein [Methanocella sp. CWC-04]MCD1293906.1 hypothetical protein [Methanocella sp. CWC-04]